MPHITHISPSPRQPKRLHIRVQNKPVATLPASLVQELGLAVGQAWDESLVARVAEAVEYDKALTRAARHVDRRARSEAQVRAKLEDWGYGPALVDRVLGRMRSLGLVDDVALGKTLVEEITRRAPAGPALLRAKLEQRGLAPDVIARVIEEASVGGGAAATETADHHGSAEGPAATGGVSAAAQLARQRLTSLRGLDARTQRRRLAGLLARRGFDEETVNEALRQIPELGDAEE